MSRLVFESSDESFVSVVEPNYTDYPEFEDETVVILEAYDSAENLNPFHFELVEVETENLISFLQNQLEEFRRLRFK